jgi:hypothetical protein
MFLLPFPITLVLGFDSTQKLHARDGIGMQDKHPVGIIIELFIVIAILGTISAVAIPNIGHLFTKGRIESSKSELHNIQTAVVAMLSDSAAGTLEPVGPTSDMDEVVTTDVPPLVLADYLLNLDEDSLKLCYTYSFTVNGTVTQAVH